LILIRGLTLKKNIPDHHCIGGSDDSLCILKFYRTAITSNKKSSVVSEIKLGQYYINVRVLFLVTCAGRSIELRNLRKQPAQLDESTCAGH
jgi:hypothetical protein